MLFTGDAMFHQNNRPFSTKDRDNDGSSIHHCAELFVGAFWHNGKEGHCGTANLNGEYLKNG